MASSYHIPETQAALQLTGPDTLCINSAKKVCPPGPFQLLALVEAVGLCYSDLKLLKQFSSHPRKGPVVSGIDQSILEEIPGYAPSQRPTVPGHEAVIRVVSVGKKVKDIKIGLRYLVQTDYRWLPTASSNAAFGYNFEGALQQYVLMDQRVITSPNGDSMLIEADNALSASAIALVEPWACVEDAYAAKERTGIKSAGRMFVVADEKIDSQRLTDFLSSFGRPSSITAVCKSRFQAGTDVSITFAEDIAALDDASFDDVIYFGSDPLTAQHLFPKIAAGGLLNIVLSGRSFGRSVETPVGSVHYGGIRIIGTAGHAPADSMRYIPPAAEIRPSDKINIVGAAGPMGVMHVIRNICQAVPGVSIYAGDLDSERLSCLTKIARPLAEKKRLHYQPYNPSADSLDTEFDYTVIMVPSPKLVAAAVAASSANAIINIFAGIPAGAAAPIDLDRYIEKKIYFVGTSGSTLDDMKTVLAKVHSRSLDTNLSVAAVSGLAGAIAGVNAVCDHSIPGKIIVYPQCLDLPLMPLDSLKNSLPDVAEKLSAGLWTKQAEDLLVEKYSRKI